MITQRDIDDWVHSEEYYNGVEPETMTTTDMVREFAEVTGQEPDEYLYAALMDEEYKEWQAADSDEGELKELADLVYVVYGYANAKRYDLETAVRRIHENNLGRCLQPDGTIKRRADGKILKNKDYPKVNLADLIKGENT